jgi:hypothetical protein
MALLLYPIDLIMLQARREFRFTKLTALRESKSPYLDSSSLSQTAPRKLPVEFIRFQEEFRPGVKWPGKRK